MTYEQILAELKTRLTELDAERAQIVRAMRQSDTPPAPEPRATSEDRAPRKKRSRWTKARRLEQSRRLKAYHAKNR